MIVRIANMNATSGVFSNAGQQTLRVIETCLEKL